MPKGTVKFFKESKGFGFIIDDETKKEYFVHISGLIDEVHDGERVSFELKEGDRGTTAFNVKLSA